nr:MAG TPA: hypothetical protein [Caudoviricetes sp.]
MIYKFIKSKVATLYKFCLGTALIMKKSPIYKLIYLYSPFIAFGFSANVFNLIIFIFSFL